MNTQRYLSQLQHETFIIGDRITDDALSMKPYDMEAQALFRYGHGLMRQANSLWPLIHLYHSFEMSYWALRRLAK